MTTREKIITLLSSLSGWDNEQITDHTALVDDLSLDATDFEEMKSDLETDLDLEINVDLSKMRTVAELVTAIEKLDYQ